MQCSCLYLFVLTTSNCCLALMLMQFTVKWLTLDCAQFRWMIVHIRRECNEKNIYNIKTYIWILYISVFVYLLLRIFFSFFFKAEKFLIYSSSLRRFLKIDFVSTLSSCHSLVFYAVSSPTCWTFFLTFFILYLKPKSEAMQDKEDFLSDLKWICHLFGIINVKELANVMSGLYCCFLVGIFSSFAILSWNFSGEVNWGVWLIDKVAENCIGNSVHH